MTPNLVTIVTTIIAGHERPLLEYLCSDIEPSRDGARGIACKEHLRFDRLPNLHFCSFSVIMGDSGFDPCLVFEATFDGPKDEFLLDVVRVASHGIDGIYQHCEGYRTWQDATEELKADYLHQHDVGAHAFFTSSPGRTVTQILDEAALRQDIVGFLGARWKASDAKPETPDRIRRVVQQELVRARRENRWAEQAPPIPAHVRFRDLITWTTVGMVALSACCLIVALAGVLHDDGVSALRDALIAWYNDPLWLHGGMVQTIANSWMRIPSALIWLSCAWLILRMLELSVSALGKEPRQPEFLSYYCANLVAFLKYFTLLFLLGFAVIAAAAGSAPVQDVLPSTVRGIAAAEIGSPTVSPVAGVFLVVAAVVVWLVLRHLATGLALALQFADLTSRQRALRVFVLDVLRFIIIVLAWLAILGIASQMPPGARQIAAALIVPPVVWMLVLLLCLFIAIAVFYAAALALLLIVRAMELVERRHFSSAGDLVACPSVESGAFVREDCGIHRVQNHLTSVTHVKPGLLRISMLRAALYLIGVLTKWWYNRGELWGLETILSARWVLIDRGRRLLFLSNYCGGCDNYLCDFCTTDTVTGLNAIWANTFVRAGQGRRISFPETRFHLWKGAQAGEPFIAYVRKSQVETAVWYSAYPELTSTNINTNAAIRQALFKPLESHELDALFQRL